MRKLLVFIFMKMHKIGGQNNATQILLKRKYPHFRTRT